MSKEFEEWDREYVKNSKFSVGPMEERLAAFTAGRALGRREMKGEAKDKAMHPAFTFKFCPYCGNPSR